MDMFDDVSFSFLVVCVVSWLPPRKLLSQNLKDTKPFVSHLKHFLYFWSPKIAFFPRFRNRVNSPVEGKVVYPIIYLKVKIDGADAKR